MCSTQSSGTLMTVDRIADTCLRIIKPHRYTSIGDVGAWHEISNARESPKVRIHGHLPRLREHYLSLALLRRNGKKVSIFSSLPRYCNPHRVNSSLEFTIPSGTLNEYIYDHGSLIQIVLQYM